MEKSRGVISAGCTVGVIRIPDGMFFFKNRDLGYEYLANQITTFRSVPDGHALRGANLQTTQPEGVSIGVNRHRVCVANTHVVSSSNVTYDVLCEQLLHGAERETDVPRIVQNFMTRHSVQGGRILVASPGWGFLVEVLGDLHRIEKIRGSCVITNTFSLMPDHLDPSEADGQSSLTRLEVASREMQAISSVGALKGMLRSHLPEKGDRSICNHRPDGGGTESSHIIQIRGSYVGWSYLIGFPCENDYRTIQLFEE